MIYMVGKCRKSLQQNNLNSSKILLNLVRISEKNYNKESDQGYFLEFDVQYTNYTKKFNELHNDLLVLPERIKIQKVENIEASLHYKYECVIHVKNLKQSLNHGLVFKSFHGVIKFSPNAWLKPYIDMNIDLRKIKQIVILKKIF